MLAAVLALASSLSWGLSDFLGGLQSRRHSLLAVLVLSQGFALVVLAAAIAAGAPTAHDAAATTWAVGSGMLGLLGLTAFYRALAIGTMSIVAPLSATGAAIPMLVGLASGERPPRYSWSGWRSPWSAWCSRGARRPSPTPRHAAPAAPPYCSRCSPRSASGPSSPGWTGRSRAATAPGYCSPRAPPEVLALLAACAVRRPGLPSAPAAVAAIAAIGFFDLLANLLFVLATGRGLLSVVGVLAALYPAVTVLLARVVLHERLTRAQDAGVLVTLAGVVTLAAGA